MPGTGLESLNLYGGDSGVTANLSGLSGAPADNLNMGVSGAFAGGGDLSTNIFNTPGGGAGGGFDISSFMDSLSKYGDLTTGIGSLFNAYNGFQSNKLAKKQFDFTKNMTNRNLSNQSTLVNNSLRGRAVSSNAYSGANRVPVQVDGSAIG